MYPARLIVYIFGPCMLTEVHRDGEVERWAAKVLWVWGYTVREKKIINERVTHEISGSWTSGERGGAYNFRAQVLASGCVVFCVSQFM